MKNRTVKFLLSCLLIIVLWACQASDGNFDQARYAYQDSSVPPEYHRSYTISWQAGGQGAVIVEVYGDTIAQQNFEVNPEDFKKLQELSKRIQWGGSKTGDASGTSHQLIQLFSENRKVYERYWDNLNQENESTKSFADFIKNHTPNLEQLLATPYDSEDATQKKNDD